MEGINVIDIDNKILGETMEARSKMGTAPRKRLADISNMQQSTKQPNLEAKQQQYISVATNEYIDKLRMENMALLKVLADRNKVIEMSGMELQRLRINLQKVQQQNLQLAQANSQMLAELNSGKDRLKTLQHELGCKKNLLKAKKSVLESKAKSVTSHASENQVEADALKEAGADKGGNKPCNADRIQQSKDESLGSTAIPVQTKEKVDKKRTSLRRQSSRFKSEDAEPAEERLCLRRKSTRLRREEIDLTEDRPCSRRRSARFKPEEVDITEDRLRLRGQSAKCKPDEPASAEHLYKIDDSNSAVTPLPDGVIHNNGPSSLDLSVAEKNEEGNRAVKDEAQETRRRSSTGRPMRKAAEKVQSYKEIPLKMKLRRTE